MDSGGKRSAGGWLSYAKSVALSSWAASKVEVALDRPVFTITFDDVAESAVGNGLPILQANDVAATWYVARSFVGEEISLEDLGALLDAGQDVQCHTHSHYRLSEGDAEGLREDARKNREFFAEVMPRADIQHFSFPYGEVSLRAKRLLLQDYRTLRSIYAGINRGSVDLGLLRANRVYSRSFDERSLRHLMRRAARYNGWVIFYTHGVSDRPDSWSCTPDELSWVVEACLSEGLQPSSVAQCYRQITRTEARHRS